MARRPFLIVAGQSNATAVAPAPLWEDFHLSVALRSPRNPITQLPQYSEGVYGDAFFMPTPFMGGQRSEYFGSRQIGHSWQWANLRGKAIQAIRFLTFYNPTPSYLNLGTGATQSYPHYGVIGAFSTPTLLNTTVRFQHNPTGQQIIRLRTNVTHTINTPLVVTADVGSNIFVTATPHGRKTGDVVHIWKDGGTVDIEALGVPIVAGQPYYAIVLAAGNQMHLAASEAHAYIGLAIDITSAGTGEHKIAYGAGWPSQTISVEPPMLPAPDIYEPFWYPITAGEDGTTTTLKLTPQFGGIHDLGSSYAPLAGGTGAHRAAFRKVSGADGIPMPGRVVCKTNPVYPGQYVVFSATAKSMSLLSADIGANTLTAEAGFSLEFANGDVIRIQDTGAGSIPAGIAFDTPYFVVGLTSSNTFSVSASLGGSVIPLVSGSVAGSVTIFTATSPLITGQDLNADLLIGERGWHRNGDAVSFVGVGGGAALPAPLAFGQIYYVIGLLSNGNFSLSTTLEGYPINLLSGAIAGTVYMVPALSTGYYVTRVAPELETTTGFSWGGSGGHILLTWASPHGLIEDEKIRFTGTVDHTVTVGTDYYVLVQTPLTIKISLTPGGTPVPEGAGGATSTITRWDSFFHFFVSERMGGTDIEFTGNSQACHKCIVSPSFRGSLTGLTVRGVTGANAGVTTNLSDIHLDPDGGPPLKAVVNVTPAFPNTPLKGDTFYIEPPMIGGVAAPFWEWALWLPWCPFEGKAAFSALISATIGAANGQPIVVNQSSTAVTDTDVVRFYTTGVLPGGLDPGRSYYVSTTGNLGDNEVGSAFFVGESYGGPDIISNGSTGSGFHAMIVMRQKDKTNPFPPGFNWPNHLQSVGNYQPFDGPEILGVPRQTFATGLAIKLHDVFGDVMYVAQCAFGGSSIAHAEAIPGNSGGFPAFSWHDPKQTLSWSPGEDNGCFARFIDVLDAAKSAFAAQGDEGYCIGIVWAQGEADASSQDMAYSYNRNAGRLRYEMRRAIKDRNLCVGKAESIPWIHPKIRSTPWQYASIVNAAITSLCETDSYSRTFEVDDLVTMLEGISDPADRIHYNGAGMTSFEDRAISALLSLYRSGSSEVEICNMALANIGETAKVTSIDPPDGSMQAAMCAQFYSIARDEMISAHPWDFTTRREALALVDNGRSDWAFAYFFKDNYFTNIIGISEAGATTDNDFKAYAVEVDSTGQRRIYTNVKDAIVVFIAQQTDPTRFSPQFVKALSWKLSTSIAGPIIKGEEGLKAMMMAEKMFEHYLAKAKGLDANRKREVTVSHTPSWLQGRGLTPRT